MFNQRKGHHLFPISSDDHDIIDKFDDDGFIDNITKGEKRMENQSNRQFVGQTVSGIRYKLMAGLIGCMTIVLVGRVGMMQVVQGKEFAAQAEDNRFRTVIEPADRGVIMDRNGLILADNTPTFNLTFNPLALPSDQQERTDTLNRLRLIEDVDEELLKPYYPPLTRESDFSTQLVLESVPYETAVYVMSNPEMFEGIAVEQVSKRSYITYAIPSLSHVLGYTGVINADEYEQRRTDGYRAFDYIGKQGVEKSHEEELRGTFGRTTLEVTASGRAKQVLTKEDPIAGKDLILSIDAGLQTKVEEVLEARMEGTPATKASVVVMNPTNGEILSLVSWPAYDANLFPEGDGTAYAALLEDERHPLFPRATAGEAPSGSTIKTMFAAAGLEEGIITPTTTIQSSGGIQVGPWFFPDWRGGGHGTTDVYHAIADSVNTFFYYIGAGYQEFEGLGIYRLMEYAEKFGFGQTTGIDLPGEADGFLPTPEWKEQTKGERWYIGDTYNTSIGQGDVLVTPLQMARATAVFANEGYLVTPRLTVVEEDEEIELTEVIPADTVDVIARAMRQTITAGSASSLQAVPVPVAGKTGTAQWSSTKPNHSWFTGFAPYENPELVITVLVEEGGDTGLAIPVTREILTFWFANSQ